MISKELLREVLNEASIDEVLKYKDDHCIRYVKYGIEFDVNIHILSYMLKEYVFDIYGAVVVSSMSQLDCARDKPIAEAKIKFWNGDSPEETKYFTDLNEVFAISKVIEYFEKEIK